ncbi:hypothetical protein EV421DRAFT_2025588 [Armillaria borealis]|uniref:Uncharacterized protein n=1 Tax=Armillaria borealis TaxID=47425 RepID=A0AA39IVE5_9AGAR|nr:hypothetical protein EV421DRAFT_2025588 [Armillaria borealis]
MTTNNHFIQITGYLFAIGLGAIALSILGLVKDIFAAFESCIWPTTASAPTEHLRIAIMVEVTTSSTQCSMMESPSSPSSHSTLFELSSECDSTMLYEERFPSTENSQTEMGPFAGCMTRHHA